jgi:hypothetical protein
MFIFGIVKDPETGRVIAEFDRSPNDIDPWDHKIVKGFCTIIVNETIMILEEVP